MTSVTCDVIAHIIRLFWKKSPIKDMILRYYHVCIFCNISISIFCNICIYLYFSIYLYSVTYDVPIIKCRWNQSIFSWSNRIMSHIRMSHATLKWVVPHIRMSHGTHIWMRRVTHPNEKCNESCRTYEWVVSHIWMSRVTHTNESHHTCEWALLRR